MTKSKRRSKCWWFWRRCHRMPLFCHHLGSFFSLKWRKQLSKMLFSLLDTRQGETQKPFNRWNCWKSNCFCCFLVFCFQGRCLWMYLDWYICAITVILRKKANLKWPRNDLCCKKIKKFYFSAKSLIGTGVTGIFTGNANHPNDTVALVLRILSTITFLAPSCPVRYPFYARNIINAAPPLRKC